MFCYLKFFVEIWKQKVHILLFDVSSMFHQEDGHCCLRIGSLILHSIGQLLPHQILCGKFNTKEYIYPVCLFFSLIISKEKKTFWSTLMLLSHSPCVLLVHTPCVLFWNCFFYFVLKVGFKTSRFYWSYYSLYQRCRYICSIHDNDGEPEFRIQVVDSNHDELVFKDNSPAG